MGIWLRSKMDMKSGETKGEIAGPFLRWAGSKRTMLPILKSHLPTRYGNYIEPFAGSACLFFDVAPQSAVLSDLNADLISTYRTVSRMPRAVARNLEDLPTGEKNFYKIRARPNSALSAAERAAQFIYLNRFCFNGLYRTNRQGQFNVPYGAPKTTNVPSADDLRRCAVLLKRTVLVSEDFETVLKERADRGDFVYLDPPFFRTDVRAFTQYNAAPFSAADLERLCDALEYLRRRRCHFLVSYAYCAEAKKAFRHYDVCLIHTRRNISGFPKHRGAAVEMLVRNIA